MSDNSLKTPLATSLPRAIQRGVADTVQLLGKALPARVVEVVSSGIVRVSFEVDAAPWTLPTVTVPVAGQEWVRLPIREGVTGVVFPADASLGGVSGLGGGTPKLRRPANLAALTFFPLGNVNWFSVDPDALVLYGLGNDADTRAARVTLTSDAATVSFGDDASVTVTDGRVDLVGELWVNGKRYLHHEHIGVMSGASTSGGVVDP